MYNYGYFTRDHLASFLSRGWDNNIGTLDDFCNTGVENTLAGYAW